VTGFTGSAVVPTIHVGRLEVGDLLLGPADLPVLADVFGGAQGVLGIEGAWPRCGFTRTSGAIS